MKLSTRERYGVRAMLELALHYGDGPVMVKNISSSQGISAPYLEQILMVLKVAGLVTSARGMRGGFTLTRSPSEITLIEIVQALSDSIAPVGCVDNPKAYPRAEFCAVHDVWAEVAGAIYNVLDSITLQELKERQIKKNLIAMQKNIVQEIGRNIPCGDSYGT